MFFRGKFADLRRGFLLIVIGCAVLYTSSCSFMISFKIRNSPSYYRGCWHEVSRCLFFRYRHPNRVLTDPFSSRTKVLYNPQAFFTHAALLDQACAHCPIFPTAASRRSLGRVSVPVWLIILSDQLPIVALVGHYPTN